MLRNATLVALSFALFTTAHAGELLDRTDRFTQKRELKWVSHIRSEAPSEMGLTASIVFLPGDVPGNALVHLAGSFAALEYTKCHVTDWLADGIPVKPKSNSYQALPRNDSPRSIEIVTSIFSIPQLKQLAAAQQVEYRVCRDEGRIPAVDHDGLRELTKRL